MFRVFNLTDECKFECGGVSGTCDMPSCGSRCGVGFEFVYFHSKSTDSKLKLMTYAGDTRDSELIHETVGESPRKYLLT